MMRRIFASAQELQEVGALFPQLIHRALRGRFVWPPAQKPRAVAETLAGNMIVADLHNQLRRRRLPLV
jgi:hypothetical protein